MDELENEQGSPLEDSSEVIESESIETESQELNPAESEDVVSETPKQKDPVKLLKIALIVVLVFFLGMTLLLLNQMNKSTDTINSLLEIINTTNNELSTLSTTATELAEEVDDLTSQLETVSSTNVILHDNLRTVSAELASTTLLLDQYKSAYNLHHFYNIDDLGEFLTADDTDTKAEELTSENLAYRLQVKAAQAGYIVVVEYPYFYILAETDDGSVYRINPATDDTEFYGSFKEPLEFYPVGE